MTEIWVNIGSGNGLLPDGTKPLPEPMLNDHQWSPSDIHIRAISQEMPQPSVTKICLKITYLNLHLNFPGANELKLPVPFTVWRNYANTNLCHQNSSAQTELMIKELILPALRMKTLIQHSTMKWYIGTNFTNDASLALQIRQKQCLPVIQFQAFQYTRVGIPIVEIVSHTCTAFIKVHGLILGLHPANERRC